MHDKLIAIVGTNASGKSGLGVELAREFGGEIISADSRQVFRGLDLGSGKITREEMKGVPHHLIDVVPPNAFFSMADFQKLAYAAADGILARGKIPFVVGGTGLYVDSVVEGYVLDGPAPDLEYRAALEALPTKELYEKLTNIMPDSGIDARNRNRVMRALERIKSGDSLEPRREKRYETIKLGVTWNRPELCARIDERLERRLGQGMVDEVRDLAANGATASFLMKLGLEYRYIYQYIVGELSYDEMLDELSRAIKRFAKRQMTWFRKDKSIIWLDMADDPLSQARAAISRFLNS